MLRAAKKASGKATMRAEQRADEGHDDGLQQLGPDVAVLPLGVVRGFVARQATALDCRVDARPGTISETTSPADLPKNGELVSKTKFGPAEEALAHHDLVALHFGAPGKAERDVGRRAVLALLDPVGQRRARRHRLVRDDVEHHVSAPR